MLRLQIFLLLPLYHLHSIGYHKCGSCVLKRHLHFFQQCILETILLFQQYISQYNILYCGSINFEHNLLMYVVAENVNWNTYQQESLGAKILPLVLDSGPGYYLKTLPSGSWGKTSPPQWPGRILLKDKN